MSTGLERAALAELASVVRRLAAVVVSIWLVGCVTRSPPVPAAADCSLRIIVSFAEGGVKGRPESTLLRKISRAARVELTYVRSLTPALHVLVLRAKEGSDCERALGRLRSDPRVRSVDIDERRQPQR